jgi:hypothetical protein
MTGGGQVSKREFHIWVDGRLSGRFADGVDGIEQHDDERGTVLHGAYLDDAHLQGVLEHLRGLGVALRRLEVSEEER